MASFALLSIIASVLVQTYGFGVIPRLDGRIVNGENAVIGDFPYQLSLQSYSSHFCGASILSRTVVLTAAHCTAAVSTNLNVRGGSSFTNSGGGTVKVSRVNQHPYYDASTFDYDVCVLQLSNSLVYGSPITLQPVGQEVADGSLAVVTGWGALYEGGPSPNQLQKVSVARVNANKCNSDYGGIITDHMICFASPGKDSCQGDSGGPLAYGGRQVGIVSWGYGCARPEYPGVYTKVSNQEINSYITRYL